PVTGAAGRPMTVVNTVRNQGPAPAGVFRITFYMSATDPTPGAGTAVGFRDLTTLATGASSPASTVVTIPATLTPGPYYVSAVADSGGLQVELDEGNNGLTASRQITVTPYQPDLVMTAVTIPARGAVGRPLTVTNTVRNQGPAPAGAFRITFYISATDPTPGAGVAVGLRDVPALGPAVSSPAVTVVTIPATLTPGIYYFSAVADSAGTQVELDETNNGFTASSQVKVTLYEPDLVMSALRAPASGAIGRPFTLTHTVTNQGPAPAGPFWITFYMSATDPTPGAGMPVWVYVVTGLGAGANLTASTAITVPEMLAPGSYFVSAIADAGGPSTELDESNNGLTTSSGVTVNLYQPDLATPELSETNNGLTASTAMNVTLYQPDLVVSTLTAPAAGMTGRPITVASSVRNQGPAPTVAFRITFYMSSTDPTPGAGTAIGFRDVAALAAGAVSMASTVLTIPATLAPTSYYLSSVADSGGVVTE